MYVNQALINAQVKQLLSFSGNLSVLPEADQFMVQLVKVPGWVWSFQKNDFFFLFLNYLIIILSLRKLVLLFVGISFVVPFEIQISLGLIMGNKTDKMATADAFN